MTEPQTFGPAFQKEIDEPRVLTQMERVKLYMLSHDWRTLSKIRHDLEYLYQTNFPEASVSAQLRHLRKWRFGGYRLERRRADKAKKGLYEYRLTRPDSKTHLQNCLTFPSI